LTAFNLKNFIKKVGSNIKGNVSPIISDTELTLLYQNLDCASPLLKIILNDKTFNGQQLTLSQQSGLLILNEIFSHILYKMEQQHNWAQEFCSNFQQNFAHCVLNPKTPTLILQYLLEALSESRWPIIKEIQEAHCNLIDNLPMKDKNHSLETITALIENIAKLSHDNEYALYFKLLAQTYKLLPTEIQSIMPLQLVDVPFLLDVKASRWLFQKSFYHLSKQVQWQVLIVFQ